MHCGGNPMKTVLTVLAMIAIALCIGFSSFERDADLNRTVMGLSPGEAILNWQQPEQWPTGKWTILIYEPVCSGTA